MRWRSYGRLDSIRRLRNEGRELLGQRIIVTEKRDGENVSLHWDKDNDKDNYIEPQYVSRIIRYYK